MSRVLLDTHVFLWTLQDPNRVPLRWLRLFDAPRTELFLSAASAWEIAIKYQLGKLSLPVPPADYVRTRCAELGVEPLSVTVEHAGTVATLPMHHKDPFDRMLIAQAATEDLTVASLDPVFSRYHVRCLSIVSAVTTKPPRKTPPKRRK